MAVIKKLSYSITFAENINRKLKYSIWNGSNKKIENQNI
jgi:hypothetical protein